MSRDGEERSTCRSVSAEQRSLARIGRCVLPARAGREVEDNEALRTGVGGECDGKDAEQ
jgi:hypothetical protein